MTRWLAALLVLTLVAACGTDTRDDTTTTTTPTTRGDTTTTTNNAEVEEGRWETLPDAPIEARLNHTATWAGDRLVVWGGGHADGVYDTGAVWDPTADEWERVPAAPIAPRWAHDAVWTGEEVIVWGGNEGPDHLADCFADGARYDPDTGDWQAIAPAPGVGGCGAAVAWTGEELLVVGGSVGGGPPTAGSLPRGGAAYDPEADVWRAIPDAPIAGRTGAASAWTGEELLVVGGTGAGVEALADGAAYDRAADRWRAIPALPIPPRAGLTGAWLGEELLVFGGRVLGENDHDRTDAARYSPADDTWREAAPLPSVHDAPAVASTGGVVYLVSGDNRTSAPDTPGTGAFLAYVADADSWVPRPAPPDGPRRNHAVAWTGASLYLWGGQTHDGADPTGAVWHPPTER